MHILLIQRLAKRTRSRKLVLQFVKKYEHELPRCAPEQLEMIADVLLTFSPLSYKQSYPIMTDSTKLNQTKFEERFQLYGIQQIKNLAAEALS